MKRTGSCASKPFYDGFGNRGFKILNRLEGCPPPPPPTAFFGQWPRINANLKCFGHLYVALSSVRDIANYFAENNELVDSHNQSVVTNIVSKNLNISYDNIVVQNEQIQPVHWGADDLNEER